MKSNYLIHIKYGVNEYNLKVIQDTAAFNDLYQKFTLHSLCLKNILIAIRKIVFT